jgi:acyl carrier protein
MHDLEYYVEVAVATAASVLGKEAVGADDNFFHHGGDSLAALRWLSRLHEETGVSLEVSEAFEAPTPRELAARIVEAAGRRQHALVAGADGRWPLTVTQRSRLDKRAAAAADHQVVWNGGVITASARVDGVLDVDVVDRAVRLVVDRHDLLRMVVGGDRGAEFLEVRDEGYGVELHREVIEPSPETPFDLEVGRRVRFILLETADDGQEIWVSGDTLVVDGYSLDLLIADLADALAAVQQGRELPRTPAVPGRQVGALEEERALSPAGAEARAYYLRLLQDRVWQPLTGDHVAKASDAPPYKRLDAVATRQGPKIRSILESAGQRGEGLIEAVVRGMASGFLEVLGVRSLVLYVASANRDGALAGTVAPLSGLVPVDLSDLGQLSGANVSDRVRSALKSSAYPLDRYAQETGVNFATEDVPIAMVNNVLAREDGNHRLADGVLLRRNEDEHGAFVKNGLSLWVEYDRDRIDVIVACPHGFIDAARLGAFAAGVLEGVCSHDLDEVSPAK